MYFSFAIHVQYSTWKFRMHQRNGTAGVFIFGEESAMILFVEKALENRA